MLTNLTRRILSKRIKQIEKYENEFRSIQENQLKNLIKNGLKTSFGKDYNFCQIKNHKDYSNTIPIQSYEELKPYIEKTLNGEENILWPGKIKYFAKSSGTTDAKSKFIPISECSYKSIHVRGGIDTIAMYLHLNKESKFFSGKSLIIGAGRSTKTDHKSYIGLLSGILGQFIHPLVRIIREPSYKTCMIQDFTEKMDKMIPEILNKNIVSFSGIPSWYQILFSEMLKKTGKQNILEIWPNIEVFFHGGVSFQPYKELFKEYLPSNKVKYLEVYNASEGFFSIQNDFDDQGMLLMLDYGIYYEFLPFDDKNTTFPTSIPLWEVELGKKYAMIISNNSGLWRYNLGDVVTFTSIKPYKIIISGRTKHFLNLCGEELMVGNADVGIAKACEICKTNVLNYTASALASTNNNKARHQWFIEFNKENVDIKLFTEILDKTLCEINSDYESKRDNDIALDIPEIIVSKKGVFTEWIKTNNKNSAQQKIPRLSAKRDLIEELIALNCKL